MSTYSLSHLSDPVLLRNLAALVARERTTTAELLAHIAEVDVRKLYLPAAYPSMHLYCVRELRLSEDAAYKRIQAARTARKFPAIFDALATGRLHLSGVCLLAHYLTSENADELLKTAEYKTKSEIEHLIAQRFPRSEMLPMMQAIPSPPSTEQLAPGQVESNGPEHVGTFTDPPAPEPAEAKSLRSKVAPVAPERFLLPLTIGKSTHDKLRYAQELLSHQVPSGDVAEVLDRALDALILKLEKTKFAATTKPRPRSRRSSTNARHIPAEVKHAVWQRDQGQCTFVSATGQRCPSRKFLEFDHIDPVARGGQATVQCVRLRCRGHNQLEAERMFGAGFMSEKREDARRAVAVRFAAKEARAAAEAERAQAAAVAKARAVEEAERAKARDVVPWLRALGFRADETRRAAALCEDIPDASLEERVRVALSFFQPRNSSRSWRRAANSLGTPQPFATADHIRNGP